MSLPQSTTAQVRAAQRLARTIASDLLLYNREKVVEGLKHDQLFSLLEQEIREGRELYNARVSESIQRQFDFLERALVDVLIYGCASVECDLW
jgi:hypothetical protein